MNTDKQRIAIAEACGWSVRWSAGDPFKYFCRPNETLGVCCGLHLTKDEIFAEFAALGECGPQYVIPNYPADLNAMARAVDYVLVEAGRKGDWRGWDSYVLTLSEMVGSEAAIEATAAQRAEAFLRTIGKWEGRP